MKKFFGAAFALALVLGGTSGAGAGVRPAFDPTLTLSPASGQPGATFLVSGSTCVERDLGTMSVEVTAPDTVEGTVITTPDGAGDWSVQLTVPSEAVGGDEIVVDASCIESFDSIETTSFQSFRAPAGDGPVVNQYDPATFTVLAAPTPTVEETTTTTEPDGEVDDADAAAPVVAQPTFTG